MSTTASKNPKVKAFIKKDAGTDRELSEDEKREKRMTNVLRQAQTLSRTTDKLANDSFALRNQPIPKGKEMFPAEWRMQYIDLFYPYSPAGPLYIDLPTTTHDLSLCERKMKVMRDKGLRYTFIKVGEGVWEGQMRLDGQDPDKIKADQAALRNKQREGSV